MNRLYYGDNLNVLREHIADESVDLVYLDPPFNSNANYNILFRSPKGHSSEAQIEAFEDTWHWGEQAEREFQELVRGSNTDVSEIMQALRRFLGENDMMAYLVMMANRLIELHRVLKPTGSIYLHCDPTASHYLKVVMDGVFGKENFLNEIIWKRTSGHNSAKRYGPIHDVILYYSKSTSYTWNLVYEAYDRDYAEKNFKYKDERGFYASADLTGAGTRTGDSGKPWKGVNPTRVGRHWAVPTKILSEHFPEQSTSDLTTQQKLDLLFKNDFIIIPEKGLVPDLRNT
jgi:adenine specific DNA methylase Mod